MPDKKDFYTLTRRPPILQDENTYVIAIGEGKQKGLCPGGGVWTTDILLPEGVVVEGVTIQIRKMKREESVILCKKAGAYAGILDEPTLQKLRFSIKFRNK